MANTRTDAHKGDILIVDDDLPSLNALSSMLTTEGYEVRGVPDGRMALTVVENKPPELILLDVRMPGMEGFEVCRKIKADEKSSGIPILFLSALDALEDKVKGFAVGGVDFITKPFNPEEVLARVHTHITLNRLLKNLENQVRKRTAAVKESEERYRTIIEASPVSIVTVRAGRLIAANLAACRTLGFSDPQEMDGMPVMSFVAPESRERIAKRIERLEDGKSNPLEEVILIRKDGTRIAVESSSVAVPIDGVNTAVVFAQDISDRKEKEEELAIMKFTVDQAMDPAAWIAPDGRFLYINEAGCKAMHYEREKLLSMHVSDVDLDVTSEKWDEHYQEIKRVGSMRMQSRHRDGKGHTRHVDLSSSHIKFGETEFICSVRRDITDLKNTEAALAEQLEFEQLIADIAAKLTQTKPEQMKDTIHWILGSLGRFLRTDRAFLALFSSDGKSLRYTHIWADEGVDVPPRFFELDISAESPWLAGQIRNGKAVNTGPGFSELPEESGDLRKLLEKDGIKSGVVLPVRFEGRSVGALIMDTATQPREYPQSVVDHLWIVAGMIGTTLHRIQVADALKERLNFERLIADIAAKLAQTEPEQQHESIDATLRSLGQFLCTERSFVAQFSEDGNSSFITNLWAAEGISRASKIFEVNFVSEIPWFAQQIRDGRVVKAGPGLVGLPDEAKGLRKWLEKDGVNSGVVVPVQVGGEFIGMLGLDNVDQPREYSDLHVDRLQIIANMIGTMLKRVQAQKGLKESLNRIQELKDQIEQENIYLREQVQLQFTHDEIVGESQEIKRVLKLVEKVAGEESNVLILGETGTGKEMMARAIHNLSARSGRSMVTVNCAALPPTLIESELFGQEKGAFTGALSRRLGRFETANGSTIFLDEIGDLPLEVQAKLLHVLQEGKFERLGSSETITADVRVIAATNRDLGKEVREGRFRRDLYYRLNVFPITVPPLRERLEDIPLLVWSFVREYERSMGKRIEKIKKKDMDLLYRYSWPGNVRELRNVVERAMILSEGSTLDIERIETHEPVEDTLKLTLEEVERNHVLRVLESTGWRVSGSLGAAEILGLKPTTLEARTKKLGIRRPA